MTTKRQVKSVYHDYSKANKASKYGEPWYSNPRSHSVFRKNGEDVIIYENGVFWFKDDTDKYLFRIKACVNALAGIEDPTELRNMFDDMVNAFKSIVEDYNFTKGVLDRTFAFYETCKDTLAEVEKVLEGKNKEPLARCKKEGKG